MSVVPLLPRLLPKILKNIAVVPQALESPRRTGVLPLIYKAVVLTNRLPNPTKSLLSSNQVRKLISPFTITNHLLEIKYRCTYPLKNSTIVSRGSAYKPMFVIQYKCNFCEILPCLPGRYIFRKHCIIKVVM